MRLLLLVLGAATISSCTSASIGDPHLQDKPNLLVEADPLARIREQIVAPHIKTCEAAEREIGPSSNIPVSEVEYPSYSQEGRTAHVINAPFSFGMRITVGQFRDKYLRVTVPAGFVTDFHSVPLSISSQTSPLRKAIAAAVVHDWMFAVGARGTHWQRDLANQAFDEVLKFYSVDSFTRGQAQAGFSIAGNNSFGKPEELRFYNKCFYRGLCAAEVVEAYPQLRTGPVLPMPDGDTHPALRAGLWEATVCIRDLAPADQLAGLQED